MMRKGVLLPAVILAGLAVAGPALADLQSAVMAVKQQPRVLDAIPDNAGNLWVTVMPDSRVDWNGYAGVMCRIVVPQHARIFLVKVVDSNSVHKSKNPRDWKLVGGANCGN